MYWLTAELWWQTQ